MRRPNSPRSPLNAHHRYIDNVGIVVMGGSWEFSLTAAVGKASGNGYYPVLPPSTSTVAHLAYLGMTLRQPCQQHWAPHCFPPPPRRTLCAGSSCVWLEDASVIYWYRTIWFDCRSKKRRVERRLNFGGVLVFRHVRSLACCRWCCMRIDS